MASTGAQRAPIRRISEWLLRPERDFIYDVLAYLPPRLAVDVGAAAGECTRRMKLAGDADTEVVAFEPFRGNFRFFEESTRNLRNVQLVPKGISDVCGRAELIVPSIVQGSESDWERFRGYSAVGFLAPNSKFRWLRRHAKTALTMLLGRRTSLSVPIETVTLDSELAGRTIDFLKIDVQGSEAKVLAGASGLLTDNRIGVVYIEWSGSEEVLDKLHVSDFIVIDSTYLAGPQELDPCPFEAIGFAGLREVNLPTGKVAYEMSLERTGVSPPEAIQAVRDKGLGWIQTDLIAVHKSRWDEFERALLRYRERLAVSLNVKV